MFCIVYKLGRSDYEADLPHRGISVPARYRELSRQAVDGLVLLYRPRVTSFGGIYTALADVTDLSPNPVNPRHIRLGVGGLRFLARPVHLIENGLYHERSVLDPAYHSIIMRPLREIPEEELDAILYDSEGPAPDGKAAAGFHEDVGQPFLTERMPSSSSSRLYETTARLKRIRLRKHVLHHYNYRCSFTSLYQPLDYNRFEAEACHLQPLEHHGADDIRNMLLLSSTFHKLFDSGLMSLEDDLTILASTSVDPSLLSRLNPDGKARVPLQEWAQPLPEFIRYHRHVIYRPS